jgi:hypothetical protein
MSADSITGQLLASKWYWCTVHQRRHGTAAAARMHEPVGDQVVKRFCSDGTPRYYGSHARWEDARGGCPIGSRLTADRKSAGLSPLLATSKL